MMPYWSIHRHCGRGLPKPLSPNRLNDALGQYRGTGAWKMCAGSVTNQLCRCYKDGAAHMCRTRPECLPGYCPQTCLRADCRLVRRAWRCAYVPIHARVWTHNLGWQPRVQGVSLTRAPGSMRGTLLGPPYPGRYARQGCIAEGLTCRCRTTFRKGYPFRSIGSCAFSREHVRIRA